jgi:uncharacterized repeat protein (TIGR01451 family)
MSQKSMTTLGAFAGLVFAAGAAAPVQAAGTSSQYLSVAVSAALGTQQGSHAHSLPALERIQYIPGSKQGAGIYGLEPKSAQTLGKPTGRWFVQLEDAPVVRHLSSTVPSFRSTPDVNSVPGKSYATTLRNKQDVALQAISSRIGRTAQVRHRYVNAINGFSMALSATEANAVRSLDSVAAVTPVLEYPVDTDVGPALIGAPGIWDGSATGTAGTMGEGIVVGILDTGINSNHPSFAATTPGGFTHTNPLGSGNFLGWCATDPTFCNDKLIGAYDFVFDLVDGAPDIAEEASPEDNNSHGSHTASTAAGNPIAVDELGVIDLPISGVAPHANIVAFDICYTQISTGRGSCPGDASVSAVEQAIADGVVDVINFSIGGGNNPYSDAVSQAFLSAVEAGIYVAASAGNSGPGPDTLGHKEPWVSTTAATTHNRAYTNAVSITGPTTPASVTGIASQEGTGPALTTDIEAEIEYAGELQADNATGCVAFTDTAAFDGKIALIDRGGCNFSVKVDNAAATGAVAVVVATNAPGAPGVMGSLEATTIPSVMIRQQAGTDLKAYIAANPTATARIDGQATRLLTNPADTVAGFSSRGPSSTIEVLKPDVAAPGVNILAAVADGAGTAGTEIGLISGTSMASPHNAGAAALLKALQPGWSPSAIKSALMLSAVTAVLKEDEATAAGPFDMGNGRIAVATAANVGLVMNESAADYAAADPALGGDPRQLNLASLYSSNCIETANCTFTRTFTSVAAGSVTWDIGFTNPPGVTMSVDVPSFTLAPGASQTVVFTADASALDPTQGFVFGSVQLTDAAAIEDPLHMNVAVQASEGVLPDLVRIDTRRDAGSQGVAGLVTGAASDLTFQPLGLVRGESVSGEIAQDSANGTPFDDTSDGVFFTTFTAPAGGIRLVAEIIAAESPDFDLFVGIDDGDGIPESSEVIDFAATAASLERVDIIANFPAATYWILAQNWAGSASQPDALTLSYGFVPLVDAGSLSVEEPASHAAGVPFDIRVFFDEPAMAGGERWYAAMGAGPDASDVFGFGVFPVDVIRGADAVTNAVDVSAARPGDTVTYTVSVQPTVSAEALTYEITDFIPDGVTYVPGSAVISAGTLDTVGDTLVWTLPPQSPWTYSVSDSISDLSCEVPLANSGAYTDLVGYGLSPGASTGEGPFGLNFGVQFSLFGEPVGTVLYFGANGVATPDVNSIIAEANGNGANAPIPSGSLPNSMLAMLWNDMVLDTSRGGGITATNITSSGVPVGSMIEFDDLILASDNSSTMDMEFYIDSRVRDGFPEIVFAYDNITGGFQTLTTGTIGLENQDGLKGIELAYNDAALQLADGFAICFDQVPSSIPETLVFQATVDAFVGPPAVITNVVVDTVDNPGSASMATSAAFTAFSGSADLSVSITDGGAAVQLGSTIDYTISVVNAGPDAADGVSVAVTLPAGFTYDSSAGAGWSCDGAIGTVTCTLSGSVAGSSSAADLVLTLVAGGATGTATIEATVSASASTFDADPSNDSGSDDTTVHPSEDLIFSDGFED